ncbi:MAG: GNAT family N-acetyltransferase [Gemmatimonadaceae bacterium]|nr:GNAT family N-acetyltransferase [Gemmatimonadaceae bacterium]
MSADPVTTFLRESPSLDPAFSGLRREILDTAKCWIDLELGDGSRSWLRRGRHSVSGIPLRSLEPALGWEQRPWVGAQGSAAALLGALIRLADWDVCYLNSLSDAETAEVVDTSRSLGLRSFVFPLPVAAIVGIDSYAALLKSRDRATNAKQRSKYRKIEQAGLVFRDSIPWSDMNSLLDRRELPGGADTDYTRSPAFRRFFAAFREQVATEGRLVEYGLYDGSKLVAYASGFRMSRVFHFYQGAYDPDYRVYRPGIMAYEKAIERILDQGADLIDFMGAGFAYFHEFTREEVPLKRVLLFSRSLRARLAGRLFSLRHGHDAK